MGLEENIRAKTQQPCCTVRIYGTELVGIESIQIENDFDRSSSSATVTCAAKRSVNPNDEIRIFQGYDGYEAITFTGYVDEVDKEAFPNKFVITARDVLKRAIDNYIVDEIQYDSVQAEAAVADLLNRSGITNYALDTTNFTIGDIEPAKFSMIYAMDAIKAIADLIGWRIWATKGGLVVFKQVYPRPATESRWSYTKDPTFGSQSGMVRVTHAFTDINVRNWVEVWGWTNPTTGETIKAVRSADSPYVPDPPRYRKCVISSELIDTQGMADWIAERVLYDLNCLLEKGEVEIQGNPTLNVGDTVRITEDWTDQSSGANYFIYGLSSRMDSAGGYMMTLQVRGGKMAPPVPPEDEGPVACFTVEQIGWGDPYWMVYVDGSCSYDPNGEIVSYDFDWGDGSAHATTVKANHHYTGIKGTQYTITLTVTDNDGETGTASITITIGQPDGSIVYDRVLYISTDNGTGGGEALGSPDSGNSWYSSGNLGTIVTQVTANSAEEEGYAWFGGANGKLWKTSDYCQTMTLVNTFASDVGALWVTRAYPNCIVAGLDNGKIYRTLDYGVTWTEVGSLEGPVRWIITRYGDVNHIMAGGGTTTAWIAETQDAGSNWQQTTFSGLESIYDGTIHFVEKIGICGRTDTSPVRHTNDNGTTWTSPTGITNQNLNSITGDPIHEDNVKLTGGEGSKAIWRTTDGLTYTSVGSLISAAATKVTKVLCEQHFYQTVFGGCDDDVELSFDSGATWKQLKDVTGTVTDIAQGPLIPQVLGEGDILVATSVKGVYGTDNWTSVVPVWTLRNTGLTNIKCNDLIKDPLYPKTYLLLTQDGLYKTVDNGATWIKNTTIPAPDAAGRRPEYRAICYGASYGTFYVTYTAWDDSVWKDSRAYLLKTTNNGATWNQLWLGGGWMAGNENKASCGPLSVSLMNDNLIYVSGQHIGRQWTRRVDWASSTVTSIKTSNFAAVGMVPYALKYQDNMVWIHGYWGTDDNIERSTDYGDTWDDAGDFGTTYVNALISHYTDSMDVMMVIDSTLYESTGGLSWTSFSTVPIGTTAVICSLSRKPTDINYIIAGRLAGSAGYPSKLWMTSDRGITWYDKTGNIPYDCGAIRAIAGPWSEDTCSTGPQI